MFICFFVFANLAVDDADRVISFWIIWIRLSGFFELLQRKFVIFIFQMLDGYLSIYLGNFSIVLGLILG